MSAVEKHNPHEEQLLEVIDFYRGLILDSVQSEMRENPEGWKFVRARLLKALGDRGLSGKILKIFKEVYK